jgi:hypothetical protein
MYNSTYYNSSVTGLQVPAHDIYSATPSPNRDTSKSAKVSPQQEYNVKPNYQTVRSAAQVQEKKKTAIKRVY